MAISPTNLATENLTPGTSVATASISPTGRALLHAAVVAVNIDSTTPVIPTMSGNNLTWVNVATVTAASGVVRVRLTLFSAQGNSPSAGSATIAHSTAPGFSEAWTCCEFANAGLGAVVQGVTNTTASATSLTVTLAAFSSVANGCYGVFVAPLELAGSFVVGSGFTFIDNDTASVKMATEYKATNDTTVDISWTTSSYALGIATEIRANLSQLPALGVA